MGMALQARPAHNPRMSPALEPRLLAHRDAIAALCRTHGVAALEVFGSAADGGFDPEHSDYDFIARFAPRDDESLARRYLSFADALEALLGRPVDLMTDHPIENPYLARAIAASRQLIYAEPAAQAPA
jgi:uncharacterized protein